jgi:DNA polymerase-3 subunit epsilon
LIDSRILAEVYLHLKGGREQRLAFDAGEAVVADAAVLRPVEFARRTPRATPLPSLLTAEEAAAHRAFIETLGPNALWLKAS